VLTTGGFRVGSVDYESVRLAGASPVRWKAEDIDEDGDMDVVVHFKTQDLDLNENSTEATLTGYTVSREAIRGVDAVRIVPPSEKKKGKGNKSKVK